MEIGECVCAHFLPNKAIPFSAVHARETKPTLPAAHVRNVFAEVCDTPLVLELIRRPAKHFQICLKPVAMVPIRQYGVLEAVLQPTSHEFGILDEAARALQRGMNCCDYIARNS